MRSGCVCKCRRSGDIIIAGEVSSKQTLEVANHSGCCSMDVGPFPDMATFLRLDAASPGGFVGPMLATALSPLVPVFASTEANLRF